MSETFRRNYAAGGHLAVIDSGKIVTVLAREMRINAHVGDREGRVR